MLTLHYPHRIILAEVREYQREGVIVKTVKVIGATGYAARKKRKLLARAYKVINDRLLHVFADTNVKPSGRTNSSVSIHNRQDR